MRRRRGEAGYILFYPLLLLAVFGVLASSCLPRYTAWYHQAVLTYEAERLAGELRLLQQASRTATVRLEAGETMSARRPELRCDYHERSYCLWRPQRNAAGEVRSGTFRAHRLSPGVRLQVLDAAAQSRISFGFNGGTVTPMSFRFTYDGDAAAVKYVVVHSGGRIRVGDRWEKNVDF